MKVLQFEWDNAKGEDYNGNHLVIGQHLPSVQNDDLTHVEIYGITLDISDQSKDYQLKRLSCYQNNLRSEVIEVTKSQAREMLISKIDEALGILFDRSEMQEVDDNLNVIPENEELEEY